MGGATRLTYMEHSYKADPNCKDCNGHGYVEIDSELVTIQSNEHRVEERWLPIYAPCHCLDHVNESITRNNEANHRTEKSYHEQWF
jgi:hypothetical protein